MVELWLASVRAFVKLQAGEYRFAKPANALDTLFDRIAARRHLLLRIYGARGQQHFRYRTFTLEEQGVMSSKNSLKAAEARR